LRAANARTPLIASIVVPKNSLSESSMGIRKYPVIAINRANPEPVTAKPIKM